MPSLLTPSAATAPRCSSRDSAVSASCKIRWSAVPNCDATKPTPHESWSKRGSIKDTARLSRALALSQARNVVVLGMETHVCVFQTARELVRRGYGTHVVADACASRTEENRAIGRRLCERAGAFVTSAETVAFDWVERAGTDAFRAVSRLVRE